MTEIEFLVQLLLNDVMSDELKNKLLARIGEIEKLRNTVIFPIASPGVVQPIYLGPIDTCLHEYPQPWMSISPPHCKKCGKQATNWITITNTTGDLPVGTFTSHSSNNLKLAE
jgi:hypothetical protein